MTSSEETLLSIDLSLTNTGWALFSLKTKKLLEYGELSPSKRGLKDLRYPQETTIRIRRQVDQILKLLENKNIKHIIIEEVNRGIGRISQRILCSLHGVLLDRMSETDLHKVLMIDSDGKHGWRSKAGLGLQLTELQRVQNKEIRKFNRQVRKGKKLKVIDIKQLAINYVNEVYKMNLSEKDSDIADAIGMGTFFLNNYKR
jgi:hypothetical protein